MVVLSNASKGRDRNAIYILFIQSLENILQTDEVSLLINQFFLILQ